MSVAGETGTVLAEHLSPYEVPMDFGKEAIPLQVRKEHGNNTCQGAEFLALCHV